MDSQDIKEKEKIKGVIYLSKIPPFLTVSKLKEMLDCYNVERVYLVKEG
jgi:hypothetical protein